MNPLRLVDTHAHVFERDLPMAPGRRYQPHHDATPEAYLAMLDDHGFGSGVLVQPSFLGTDNSYLLAAIAGAPDRLRGVAVLDDPATTDLAELHDGGVRGVRLNLVGRDVPDLSSSSWQRSARRLAALGWHLEIQATETQWAELAPHVVSWPGRVVVDHLGLPGPADAGVVASLAALDHVWVKVSAPYRSGLELATARGRSLVDAGLVDRLVFGTDWPFTQHEGQLVSSLVGWARSLVGDAMFDDQLPRQAAELFQLG
ncbi:amidohydrolase family protein [Aeromicrobium fastidiosum]|uniref:Amidohydrolase family protein n=1 Tax=Aeromicrobium fastidiosum TaxID=52699 RepID=A0A641ATC3_9ACTN|nr:amidohydrolase family protein [Aeromicrobium fastidiosum]KAA1380301.1 amidohydrolase family protein [Aeromicrobium fastidiosum]MBP2389856.1 putative TIM-barrel fold metal-dependent hydrolase [Aeromicrobium fastidiosum]